MSRTNEALDAIGQLVRVGDRAELASPTTDSAVIVDAIYDDGHGGRVAHVIFDDGSDDYRNPRELYGPRSVKPSDREETR